MSLQDFISLAKSLQPALFRIPLLGNVNAYDSYNRATTIFSGAEGPVWREDAKGFWFGQRKTNTAGSGALIIADAAELRMFSGTIFWTARSFSALAAESTVRMFWKRGGGGTTFDLHIGWTNRIDIYDGTVIRSMTSAALANSHSGAVRYVTGGTPQLFVDGVYRVDATGTINPQASASSVYLANSSTLDDGSKNIDYGCFLIFNDAILGRPISDQEIAQLHDAWEAIISIKAPKRTISIPKKATDIVTTAPLLHLAGPRTPSNLWPDLSGNGRDGTISGRVTQTKDQTGVVQQGYGAGVPLIITASDASLAPANITVSLSVTRRGAGKSNAGCIITLNDNLTFRTELISNSTLASLQWIDSYADGYAIWQFPVPALALNAKMYVTLRHNRADPTVSPQVWVDGEAQVVTVVAAKVGALVASAAPRISLLNRGDVALDWDGAIKDVKVYGSLLPDAACRALYVDYALSDERRLANRTDYPVSVAAVTAAGGVGPWNWLGQSLNWSDDGTRRRLFSNGVNSRADYPSSQAYGAWYWRQKATSGTNSSIFMPIASARGVWGVATQNGYIFDLEGAIGSLALYIMKIANGLAVAYVLNTAAGAVAHNVEYEFFLTRRPRDGMFTVYIRGGAYATWTVIGVPAADATYTTSVAVNVNINANDTLSDVTLIAGGGTLVPTEVPWLV